MVHERSALGDQVGLCTNALTTRGIIPNIKHPLVVETEKYSFQCQEGRDNEFKQIIEARVFTEPVSFIERESDLF